MAIDKRYETIVDLTSNGQTVSISGVSASSAQIVATTFLTGPRGADGTNGTNGEIGAQGATGPGVASGGTAGQFLRKTSSTDYDDAWHTPVAADITDFDTEVSNNTDVAANTTARHTHSNKALLDTYDQTNANIADAVTKKHAHANQAVLDAVTAAFTTADETKLDGIDAFADLTVDATNLLKGKIKLAGDLGGTADTPWVKRTSRFIIAPYGDTRPADYVCSGPSNNHIEINAAIVAANALPRGADVELLDGYFELGGRVMRLPNVSVYGQGIGHTKVGVVAGGSFTMFDMDKVTYNETNPLENSVIADMELSGENMASTSEKKAINGGNFKNCHIYRIWAHDTTATGIGDDDFYGTTIDQCLVTNCGYQNKRTFINASWSGNVFTYETSTAHGYIAWATATGTLTASGTVSDGETVTIAGIIYTFKTTLTGAAFEVLIGASTATALANLKSAVNLTGTIGTDYGTATTKHPSVTAGALTATTLAFSANSIGSTGNSIATTETGVNLSFGGATLSGGVSGNKIVIAGMVPELYNGTFNVSSVPDSTHFTISSSTNSTGLNFTINPGAATTLGNSSDSILGHNGIGIASGALEAESCIVTNCVAIGNQNNNFLIESDNNNSLGNEIYLFSNCVSISAGSCGYRNTGSLNAQFNNCYDYGSPIGAQAGSTFSSKTITAASWLAGVVTFTASSAYIFEAGERVTISGMVPEAYNGFYTVQSTPTSTTFTVNLVSDPGVATHLGTSSYEAHPVDGSSFNSIILSHNLDYGLLLPDEGVIVNAPVIKNCYNYGIRLNSVSNCHVKDARIYNNGRQGISVIMGGGVYAPMDHLTITGHIYNNGQRFANCDGIDVDPSATSSAIQNVTIDVHAYDNQETKTQRYGVILRSGGTLTNIHVKGNLTGNATGPILLQNTSDTIYLDNVIGVNPSGKKLLGNITGSTTFDVSLASTFIGTLTGNITAVMPTPSIAGTQMVWILAQDGTGSRTLSLPANAASGTTLTLSTAPSAVDIIRWIYDTVGGKWRMAGKSLGNPSVGTLKNLIITTANTDNVTSLAITQNDTTNNPVAELLTNAGTNHGIQLIQNGVQGSSKYALFVDSSAAQVNAALVRMRQNSASATQATLQLDNAGSGPALNIATGALKVGTLAGLLKGTTGTVSAATAGTDYLAPAAIGTTVQAYDADLDTWATKTAPSGTVVGTTDSQTLANKYIQRRITSQTGNAPTFNADNCDVLNVTAITAAINLQTNYTQGTRTSHDTLWVSLTANGAYAITWMTNTEASTVALPTVTINGTLDIALRWNAATSKYRCMATA